MTRLSRFLPKFLRSEKHQQNDAGEKNVCKVILLDETEFKLPFKGSLRGQYLLDKVFDQLNLFEKDYFSVRYLDGTGQTHWLDNLKTLSSQLKGSSIPYTFYFGVKFYAADPCKLREEITRYLFFLQVKQDILHGRLPVSFEDAAELFSYAVQSEIGDFDPQRLVPGYVSEFQFVPNQTEELEEQIEGYHRRLGGTIPATAELKFLDKVKWLDMYGVDLHPVTGEGNTEYFLGLTPTGIVVYKNKTKVGNYFWPRITKVNFKAKVFIIKVRDKINDEHTYAFELATKVACKHLWKCCVEHHAFFRLNQLGEANKPVKQLRSVSKSRSGRSDRQSNTEQQGRDQPRVLRVPSRRQARRAISDPRLNGDASTGIQYNDGHITLVVTPEQVKGPRHRSLPDLKGRESPTSTRSAPWETNRDTGLYTSGRSSPVSVTQSENVRHHRNRDSDSESGYRKNYHYGYDSDPGVRKRHHRRSNQWSGYYSGNESDAHSERRKYFPSSRKGSDNESDVSFTRRRRREGESGSESDVSSKYTGARRRQAKTGGQDRFETEWQQAMQSMYLPGKENRPNGSIPSIHSAPGGEARQKKTRRRRSKSPNVRRPPEELRQHIEFEMVDPTGYTEDQLREIPFTNVETKAEPFKVKYSPKTRHRYRSPKRKPPSETDSNANIKGYIPNGPPPPYTRTPERTPEPVHRARTPERTVEPKHKINMQPSGHFSDSASVVSSMSRQRSKDQRQGASYNQNMNNINASQTLPYNKNFNNVMPQHNMSLRSNIRSIPQFKENLFYQPQTLPSPRSLPNANVFKPIDSTRADDNSSTMSHTNVNSTPELPNKQNDKAEIIPAPEDDLDLQGHANIGQGQEEEEDRNQDSGLNSSLGNSSYGSGSAGVNTTPRGRGQGQGQIYGTQDAIARLYSSPAGGRRPGPPGSQSKQLLGNQAGILGNRYTGNQAMDQTGSRNTGNQVVTSENTAFRSYQSNTFAGKPSYNPHPSQYDRRPQTSYAQVRPQNNPYPQTETGASNSRYDNSSNRYNSPHRTNGDQSMSGGEGHSNAQQETGYMTHSMPKNMFYNPTVSQTGSQYTDNLSQSRSYNETQSNIPTHNQSYRDSQNRNIPSGRSVTQNSQYPNASMFYNHPESLTTETSGFVENGGPVVQPTWQYVGNGSIPSSGQSKSYMPNSTGQSQGYTPSSGQSQGYTPSSYQQKAQSSGNRSPYTRSPGASPGKNAVARQQLTPEQSRSRSTNQSITVNGTANQSLNTSLSANQIMSSSVSANQSLTSSMTASPRQYRSPDSAISSLTSMSGHQMSNQSSPQRGSQSYNNQSSPLKGTPSFNHSPNKGSANYSQSPQRGTSNYTYSPQKGVPLPTKLSFSPSKVGDPGYARERTPGFGGSNKWTEL